LAFCFFFLPLQEWQSGGVVVPNCGSWCLLLGGVIFILALSLSGWGGIVLSLLLGRIRGILGGLASPFTSSFELVSGCPGNLPALGGNTAAAT